MPVIELEEEILGDGVRLEPHPASELGANNSYQKRIPLLVGTV